MSPPAGSLDLQPRSGTFHGQPTIGLAGSAAWFEALADRGPRIVRLGLAGGPNLLAETPDISWPTADGPYRLWGGHRLWLAPEEDGRNARPDAGGLAVEPLPGGLRLTGAPDPETACTRSIDLRLDACRPLLRVRHEVANRGRRTVELAPWAITQLPPGGTAVLPQARAVAGHATRPNRAAVLWPYTSWEDPRLALRDGVLAVRGAKGGDLKVGSSGDEGWAAWARDGVALVRRWLPVAGAAYPDLGCTTEVFVTERYTELEVLGPLRVLEPGGIAVLDETWELREVTDSDPARLREALAQPLEMDPASATRQHEA